ncbi:asparaginase [Rhizorhabdus wittichii]|uniref:Asparaginase n=1 Tax=Rhizorhabdus wittichii TaxID=160791 RepID=A0A975D935_9SPHN|nr:asparaginase domain-containing protein [Rhizorhabdus wittichii]QTH23980.1 asparaginase [Rhizorhabdus wittichii]
MTVRESITILTTGGTIDKTYFDALSAYQIVDTAVGRLLNVARVTHPFGVVELLRKDSLELSEEDRSSLAAAVREAPTDRIIITHGTDTMALTAERLSNVRGKTIVLVGAWAPARFAETDAPFNLGMAFACCQVAPPGVYITMNGTVFRGEDAIKDRNGGSFVRKAQDELCAKMA